MSVAVEGQFETTIVPSRQGSTNVEGSLLLGGLAPCIRIDVFHGCLPVQVGAFQGRGIDAVDPSPRTGVASRIGGRVGFSAPANEPVSIGAQAELWVPIVRTSLRVDDELAWTAPPVSGGVSITLVFDFR